MGCGNSKTGEGMMDKLKTMAFSMVAKTSGDESSNSQFDFIKNLVMSKFKNANVQKEVDPNMGEGGLDLIMDNEKLHSTATDGKLDESKTASIMQKITSKLG